MTWRLGFFIFTLLFLFKGGILLFAHSQLVNQGIEPTLCAWDCPYYQTIASTGYRLEEPGVHGTLAFFPLIPIIGAFLSKLTHLPFAHSITLWNLILFSISGVLFLIWSKQILGRWAFLGLLLFTLDRTTFWSHVPYTESTFIFLMLLALVIDRTRFSNPKIEFAKPFIVSLIAGISSASRLIGVSIIGALGLSRFSYFLRRPHLGLLCLLIGLCGLLSFFFYVHVQFGSWQLSPQTTAAWGRHFTFIGFFKNFWLLLKAFYLPTVPVLLISLWVIFRNPKNLFTAFERWLFFVLLFIPMAQSIPASLTRYLSALIIAPVFFDHYFSTKFLLAKPLSRKIMTVLLVAFLAGELFWQTQLTLKFLKTETFNWAG